MYSEIIVRFAISLLECVMFLVGEINFMFPNCDNIRRTALPRIGECKLGQEGKFRIIPD